MQENNRQPAAIMVAELAPGQRGQAAWVLAEAFKTEEVTAYQLDMERPSALRRMAMLDGIFVQLYQDAGRPVLAALKEGQVVGVGMVRDPRKPVSKRLAAALAIPHLHQILALFARRPLRSLRILLAARNPGGLTKPYFTFEALGVHPEHQGEGAGKALVLAVQALVENIHELSGIYLNTGSEENRSFYSNLGYDTLCIDNLGSVSVYHMFWHNPAHE